MAAGRHILCIVPINTIQNWIAEFNAWLPPPAAKGEEEEEDFPGRSFGLHVLNDALKNLESRGQVIVRWKREGGVLLMGYELYRQLATKKPRKKKHKPKNGPECIDLEVEDRNKALLDGESITILEEGGGGGANGVVKHLLVFLNKEIHTTLVDPGPDVVICDEGHRIKNSHASISQV